MLKYLAVSMLIIQSTFALNNHSTIGLSEGHISQVEFSEFERGSVINQSSFNSVFTNFEVELRKKQFPIYDHIYSGSIISSSIFDNFFSEVTEQGLSFFNVQFGSVLDSDSLNSKINQLKDEVNGIDYRNCTEILAYNELSGNGIYTIDPDGKDGDPSFDIYCDMDRGGLSLVAHITNSGEGNDWTAPSVSYGEGTPAVYLNTAWMDLSSQTSTALDPRIDSGIDQSSIGLSKIPADFIIFEGANVSAPTVVKTKSTLQLSPSLSISSLLDCSVHNGNSLGNGIYSCSYNNCSPHYIHAAFTIPDLDGLGYFAAGSASRNLGTGDNWGSCYLDVNTRVSLWKNKQFLKLYIKNIVKKDPVDCQDVLDRKFKNSNGGIGNGFYSIDPDGWEHGVDPYLVYCGETIGINSCNDILTSKPLEATSSGMYLIDPDGVSSGNNSFPVYCDMITDGGGWTLALATTHNSNMTLEYPLDDSPTLDKEGWVPLVGISHSQMRLTGDHSERSGFVNLIYTLGAHNPTFNSIVNKDGTQNSNWWVSPLLGENNTCGDWNSNSYRLMVGTNGLNGVEQGYAAGLNIGCLSMYSERNTFYMDENPVTGPPYHSVLPYPEQYARFWIK